MNTMFRQILATQWRWSGLTVTILTVVGFGIPIWALQRAGLLEPLEGDVVRMLDQVREVGVTFPFLALIGGTLVAAQAFAADQRGGHVYALSLPTPRWYYVLLRFTSGLVLLAPVAIAVGLGATIAVATAQIPEGLFTYAGTVTLRFILATLVVYAAVFALAAASGRTRRLLGIGFLTIFGVQLLTTLAGLDVNLFRVVVALFEWPGPFRVIVGPWMLVDL